MTFDDDHVRLQTLAGLRIYSCKACNIEWPPPDVIIVHGFSFRLVTRSTISDVERSQLTNVMRGADYESVSNPKGQLLAPLRVKK